MEIKELFQLLPKKNNCNLETNLFEKNLKMLSIFNYDKTYTTFLILPILKGFYNFKFY